MKCDCCNQEVIELLPIIDCYGDIHEEICEECNDIRCDQEAR